MGVCVRVLVVEEHAWSVGQSIAGACDWRRSFHRRSHISARRTRFLHRSSTGCSGAAAERLVSTCHDGVVLLSRHVVGIEKLLEPLNKLEVVLESPFHQLLHRNYLQWMDIRDRCIQAAVKNDTSHYCIIQLSIWLSGYTDLGDICRWTLLNGYALMQFLTRVYISPAPHSTVTLLTSYYAPHRRVD